MRRTGAAVQGGPVAGLVQESSHPRLFEHWVVSQFEFRHRRRYNVIVHVNSLDRQVRPDFLDRQIYHTGSWSGFRNLVTYQPDEDVTVIVLSNNYHQRAAVFLL
jgi:hypothetical protein